MPRVARTPEAERSPDEIFDILLLLAIHGARDIPPVFREIFRPPVHED